MLQVAITTTSFGVHDQAPLRKLKGIGVKVKVNPYGRKLEVNEVVKFCNGACGIIAGTETLDAQVLSQLPGLKVISRCGTGLDNIDLAVAKKMRVRVFNTPEATVGAVAELTIGFMLAILRNIPQMNSAMKEGKWEKKMGNLLCCKKVGIIGFGRIGKRVAELLKCFGCQLAYSDPFVKKGVQGARRLSKGELLRWADIVTLHVSGSSRLLGENEIKIMKKEALLINASRGGLVDEGALFKALQSGRLKAAAIDCFAEEPYSGPLKGLDNAILSPHIGSYAVESRVRMEMAAVENLIKFLTKERICQRM